MLFSIGKVIKIRLHNCLKSCWYGLEIAGAGGGGGNPVFLFIFLERGLHKNLLYTVCGSWLFLVSGKGGRGEDFLDIEASVGKPSK